MSGVVLIPTTTPAPTTMADAVLRGGTEARAAVAGWLANLAARNDGRDFSCTPARRRRRVPKPASTDAVPEGAPHKQQQAADPTKAPPAAHRGLRKSATTATTATKRSHPHASSSSLRSLTSSFSATPSSSSTTESLHEARNKKRRKTTTPTATRASNQKYEDEGSTSTPSSSFSSSTTPPYHAPSSSPAADLLPLHSFPPLPSPFPVDTSTHYHQPVIQPHHHPTTTTTAPTAQHEANAGGAGWGGQHRPLHVRSGSWSGGSLPHNHHLPTSTTAGYGGYTLPPTTSQWDAHHHQQQHYQHQPAQQWRSGYEEGRKWSMPAVLEHPPYGGGEVADDDDDDWDACIRVLRTKTIQQEPPMAAPLRHTDVHSSMLDYHHQHHQQRIPPVTAQQLTQQHQQPPLGVGVDDCGITYAPLDDEVEALLRSVLPS